MTDFELDERVLDQARNTLPDQASGERVKAFLRVLEHRADRAGPHPSPIDWEI